MTTLSCHLPIPVSSWAILARRTRCSRPARTTARTIRSVWAWSNWLKTAAAWVALSRISSTLSETSVKTLITVPPH